MRNLDDTFKAVVAKVVFFYVLFIFYVIVEELLLVREIFSNMQLSYPPLFCDPG